LGTPSPERRKEGTAAWRDNIPLRPLYIFVYDARRAARRPIPRMSFLLTCPHCGIREVTDFAYGGEVVPRPQERPSERELNDYNYFRRNVAGVQREWWYHRSGCRTWFLAERDTRTNEVLSVSVPE
jgi:heterotetrameric sarcosine oxidase delta subunit